ncbi:MAG: HlyD family secretion protein [bacterium]|nr:MAG: HlyD family secretion protein [bacterium]
MNGENEHQVVRNNKKRKAFIVLGTVVVIGLSALFIYRAYARTHVTTDDAFVEASIHMIAARVSGTINQIAVNDNQPVKAGDTLASLDPEPYQRAVEEAAASLRSEEGRLTETLARVTSQERRVAATKASVQRTLAAEEELLAAVSARIAEVQAKSAALDQSRLDLARAEKLSQQEVIPKSRYDRARTAFEMASASFTATQELKNQAQVALKAHKSTVNQALAQLKAEEAALESARASVMTQEGQIARRKAQLDSARLHLSYTTLVAPADGFVTRLAAEVGNTVQAGQPLMSLVNLGEAYVVANYKETKIGRFQEGQRVVIRLDSYPGQKFQGTLDSIMAGTGAAFTLFPPENASGNYVKVVQRVPVKITFDDLEEVRPLLRIGMSVVPTILIE